MPGSLFPAPKQRFYDTSGKPLVGGKVTTWAAGTSSKKTTFQDRALTSANTNPAILDARGEATMYGVGIYRVRVEAANGALIYDRDDVEVYGGVLDAIVVDIADVEAARAAAIVDMNSDVAAVDTYRIAGQGLIDADTAAVDARRVQAVNVDIPAILTGLAAFNERGAWATGTAYAIKDIYISASIAYVVTMAHTSSTIAADLADGKVAVHQGATREELAARGGAGLVGVAAAGANAILRTTQSKISDIVNAKDWPSFAAALTDIGTLDCELEVTSPISLSGNSVIPKNISLYIKNGGSINQGAFTLKINGRFRGGWYQLFTGSGAVTFGPATTRAVSPLWWGNNATPGTTDMQPALAKAVASLSVTDGTTKIELPPEKLFLASPWVINTPVIVQGFGSLIAYSGAAQTHLIKSSAMNAAAIQTKGVNVHLRDFALIGQSGNLGDGIHILSNGVTLNNVRSNRMGGNGIRIGSDVAGNNSNNWTMIDVIANDNIGHGVYCHDFNVNSNAGSSIKLTVQSNGGDGVNIGKSQVNTWVGTLAEFNTGWGCRVNPPENLQTLQSFIGGDYEANTAGQFRLEPTAFLNYLQVHCVVSDLGKTSENTIVNIGNLKVPRVIAETSTITGGYAAASVDPTIQRITHPNTNQNNRNYAWKLLSASFGDFGLFQSSASGGDAASGGIAKLFWKSTAGPGQIFGLGVPVAGDGINGDFYFNRDGGAMTSIYQKRGGAWVGVV